MARYIGGFRMAQYHLRALLDNLMNTLVKTPLGQNGIDYVTSCLQKGGKGLPQRLLQLPLAKGTTYSPLPELVSSERAKQFDTGGLMNMSDGQTWLAEHVLLLSSAYPSHTIVFHDVWGGRPGDSGIKNRSSRMFFNQSDLYHFVGSPHMSLESILTAMRELASFLLVGAFVDIAVADETLPTDKVVDEGFITMLAQHTREIFVSAYDQEGIVVWQRPG